jgi:ring-1,2-phenylacetyl-CoA epoxidase subunit PaaE
MHLLSFRITNLVNETPESRSFYLALPGGEEISYEAGQFITLIIELNGKEVRRSYSLCSTPGVDEQLFITVKRVQNGAISRYLYDHLKVGDSLTALPPAGRFTIQQRAELYFFIAAGSGITPVISLLKEVLFKRPGSKAILLYQNTNEAQSIFRSQLLMLKQRYAQRFELIELFSRPVDHKTMPHRLNNYLLERIVLEQVHTLSVLFYVCGPRSFMLISQFTLRVMGYAEEAIKKENFLIDKVPPPPLISDPSPHQVIIQYGGEVHTLSVAYPHNILEVALKNNIQLPYSCRGGTCSTCMATCTKGKVKMSVNEVLTEADLEQGLVLTCVGYPETDVELVIR